MIFPPLQGIIALDIDGTLTDQLNDLPLDVVSYLADLYTKGWLFIFLTGRPFRWVRKVVRHLPFPYFLAVQNGAAILDMPSYTLLDKRYLSKEQLFEMESICREEKIDFVIYSGFETGDKCYYRPLHLPPSLLSYMERRAKTLQENWQPVKTFQRLRLSSFASLKCFAQERQAIRLEKAIETRLGLHAPRNRDPFDSHYFVIQATHPEATKGQALSRFIKSQSLQQLTIIAAGDDYNDLSMLLQAHIKIVMATAPKAIRQLADITAPSAKNKGILIGLKQAIQLASIIKREEIK